MEYQNRLIAEVYDVANPWGPDAEFYVSLVGREPREVLDLGCGTGVFALSVAERGHRVTGVDPADAMLDVARRKPDAERVEWVAASAQSYRSAKRFDLIVMMGHAFQCLLTDAETLSVLETMRAHLKQNGRVAFETRNPRIDWASEWAGRLPRKLVVEAGEIIETLEVDGYEGEFISFRTHYQFQDRTLTTSSRLRFPSKEHVEELMAQARLAVVEALGDWDGSAFDAARSREIIVVARVR
jgi:ubiquinone/menaquinone biosynthesis C-methylase UbiE